MTLKRVLEPELIESEADALGYAAIDRAEVSAAFADLVADELGFRGGSVIDLGAGPCDIPLAICRRIKGAKITAVELSPAMLGLAAENIARARLGGRITLLRGDAKRTKLPAGSFDLVICNNLVHHFSDPYPLFCEAARLCRPGGGLLLRDLRRPRTLAELDGHIRRIAGVNTPRQQQLLRNSLRAALTAAEAGVYARMAGLDDLILKEEGLKHWQLQRAAGRR